MSHAADSLFEFAMPPLRSSTWERAYPSWHWRSPLARRRGAGAWRTPHSTPHLRRTSLGLASPGKLGAFELTLSDAE